LEGLSDIVDPSRSYLLGNLRYLPGTHRLMGTR
jgi:hypothetical protein